ncbi:hypothetical protein [Pseudomonas sp. GL-B-16]|uniref:hypothetical protein n=1 Tax=Pseudomonas sp. GL-B-16 TaxID=2832373 RepID=UPI001CC13963|nr:hypothetical protein [Pseudomonas sp. GL-B-16]
MELIGISCHPSIDRDDEHPEESMGPISGRSTYNVQASSAHPAEAAQTAAGTRPSGHASKLTSAMLSHHALAALNAKETQGDEQEKTLAGFAKEAMRSGQLRISPNQPANGIAQFGMKRNQDVLVIQAKLNEQSEYDVLSVGLRRGSEAHIFMTLPGPTTAVAGTARHPSGLLDLPNELLLQIADSTGKRGEGVNLSLRHVNKQMKFIADAQMSPEQRFVIENGQTLQAVGHTALEMRWLAVLPKDQQNFVLTHVQTLKTLGYTALEMRWLAILPEDQQNFILAHGQTLKTLGHTATEMRLLAPEPEDQRNFVLTHGQTLKTLGHTATEMRRLAAKPEDRRNFVLAHGQMLKTLGHTATEMRLLASEPEDQRNFVLAHGQTLQAIGFASLEMGWLAADPEDQRNFVLTHGQTIKTLGYNANGMRRLAARPEDRKAFLQQIGHPV